MNYATRNLEDDHVNILRLIDVMEIMVQVDEPNVVHLEEVVDLIRNYADGLHHAKEESLLFPLMAERGFSMLQGPIAVMLQDHTDGRNYVKGIAENIQLLKEGDLSALNLVYHNMLGYADLLRNHIAKENSVLFRMADNALTPSDHQSLIEQFAQIEGQSDTSTLKTGFVTRIEKLIHVYNPMQQTIQTEVIN
jgi:hemerythrin-like domain-containing protein